MAYKFLDATGKWSDPANTTLKYLRADGQWTVPDMEHKFLDATGNWSIPIVNPLMAISWNEIAAMSDNCAGTDGSDYTKMLGLCKDVEVTGLGIVKAKLIGINHDTFTSGGTAGFTFQLTNGISWGNPENFKMNERNNNTGGWKSSQMRWIFLPNLLTVLPDDLQNVIKEVDKKTSIINTGTEVSSTSDKLWLLSLVEAIGNIKNDDYPTNPIDDTNYLSKEGSQYTYYAKEGKASHIIQDFFGYNEYWWLRSIYPNGDGFYRISPTGDFDYGDAALQHLPAVGFCVTATS